MHGPCTLRISFCLHICSFGRCSFASQAGAWVVARLLNLLLLCPLCTQVRILVKTGEVLP